jgi:anti-anti-sigma factor
MLSIHTTKLGTVAVLFVQGQIVRGETDALRSTVLAQVDASAVVLDLAKANTIDAGGLGVMLELREHTQSRGIEFRLKNVTRLVRRVLEITRLTSVFEVTPELEDLPRARVTWPCQQRNLHLARST